jgi:hypothetical protein
MSGMARGKCLVISSGESGTKVAKAPSRPAYPRRIPHEGIRQVSTAIFQLKDLSEGGAAFRVGNMKTIPDHFYIQFGDDKTDLVTCYVVQRGEDTINCKFSEELSTAQVDDIVLKNVARSVLDDLFGQPEDAALDELFGV